jgi:hypothetical protein
VREEEDNDGDGKPDVVTLYEGDTILGSEADTDLDGRRDTFIEYRDGLTVMEAILEAGGFTKFANPNDTIIYRKDESRRETANDNPTDPTASDTTVFFERRFFKRPLTAKLRNGKSGTRNI